VRKVFELPRDCDAASLPTVRRALLELARTTTDLVVDVSQSDPLSPNAAAVVVTAARICRSHGGRLTVRDRTSATLMAALYGAGNQAAPNWTWASNVATVQQVTDLGDLGCER
jgi:hypothetical protein